MDTPLKERLVGAAVLVAVVVLVLPELFTGQAARPPPAIAHDAGGVPLRTHEFDLGNSPAPAAAPPAEVEPAPAVAPPATVPAAVGDAAPTSRAPVGTPAVGPPPDAPPSGIPPSAARPAPVAPPPATLRPSTATPPATTPRVAAAAPQAAPPRSAAPPKPTMDQGASGWVVQLGSFATRANAEKLVGELRAKGYRAFTLPYTSGGRTLHRVRVGPEQDRDRADALARRLKGDGYPGTVAPHP